MMMSDPIRCTAGLVDLTKLQFFRSNKLHYNDTFASILNRLHNIRFEQGPDFPSKVCSGLILMQRVCCHCIETEDFHTSQLHEQHYELKDCHSLLLSLTLQEPNLQSDVCRIIEWLALSLRSSLSKSGAILRLHSLTMNVCRVHKPRIWPSCIWPLRGCHWIHWNTC